MSDSALRDSPLHDGAPFPLADSWRQRLLRKRHAGAGQLHRLYRAVRYALPYRRSIIAISLLTLALAAISAAEPLLLKYIFDELAADQQMQPLAVGVAGLLLIGLVREGLGGLSNWLTWRSRIGVQYALLEATVGRLHRTPLRLKEGEGVGAIITRLDRSIQGFIGAVTQILFNLLPAVVYLVIALAIMIQLDWRLALLVVCFAPMPALLAAFAAPGQTRRERTLLDSWARIYSRFNEVLSGIVTVRSFAMEDSEKRRFLQDVDQANRVVIRGVGVDTGFGAAANLVIMVARIAAIAFGGVLVLRGDITVGTVVAFVGYVGGLFGPVQGLSGIYQTLQRASVSLDEIFAILDAQDHLPDRPDAQEVTSVRGEVTFENVSFSYEQSTRSLLNGLDLAVRPGETLAIVGPSGSGKTTLMALLMRLYDPQAGAVRLDGMDLRSLKQDSLRRQIGVVLQDPLLFNDTVRNNIAYASPDATQAEIEAAARAANAHDFVSQLPQGYDTCVGERGARLSVGERQRIAIARALIKNPPIVILDEATSALDAESETLVQDALDRLLVGRTSFVIAHRLSTVVHADRIIVLKEGRIVESGTHRELVRAGGYYASLVQRQVCGLIQNDE